MVGATPGHFNARGWPVLVVTPHPVIEAEGIESLLRTARALAAARSGPYAMVWNMRIAGTPELWERVVADAGAWRGERVGVAIVVPRGWGTSPSAGAGRRGPYCALMEELHDATLWARERLRNEQRNVAAAPVAQRSTRELGRVRARPTPPM
jgi:hypothetical protein